MSTCKYDCQCRCACDLSTVSFVQVSYKSGTNLLNSIV